MLMTEMPTVFRNFSSANATTNTYAETVSPQNKHQKPKNNAEPDIDKRRKKHPVIKAVLIAAGALAAFVFGVPAIKNGLFGKLDPGTIELNTKSDFAKKGFIEFADQVKAKRQLTGDYINKRFKKVCEIIRRNFFSYNQKKPEKLTPVKKFPQKFVSGMGNEWRAFREYLSTMFHKIPVIYEETK